MPTNGFDRLVYGASLGTNYRLLVDYENFDVVYEIGSTTCVDATQ